MPQVGNQHPQTGFYTMDGEYIDYAPMKDHSMPAKPIAKGIGEIFQNDTIEMPIRQAEEAKKTEPSLLEWLLGFFYTPQTNQAKIETAKTAEQIKGAGFSKPSLIAPDYVDRTQLSKLADQFRKINEMRNDSKETDRQLNFEAQFIELIKLLSGLKKEALDVSQEGIQQEHQEKKKINQERLELLQKKLSQAKWTGYLSSAESVVGVISLGASAIAFISGGTTTPFLAVVGLINGFTTATKGLAEYRLNQHNRALLLMQEKNTDNEDSIKRKLGQAKEAFEALLKSNDLLKQIITNQHETIIFIMQNK